MSTNDINMDEAQRGRKLMTRTQTTHETEPKSAEQLVESIKETHDMGQREIADQIGVSEMTVHHWAAGRHNPHPESRERLEHLLAVGPADRDECEARGEVYLVRCASCGIEGLEPCPEDVAQYAARLHNKWEHIGEDVDVSIFRAWPQAREDER